jgi:SAM-dependent methyltransferase
MRILYATMAPLRQGPAGLTSDLASARYRVLIPAQQLARLGHGVQVAFMPPGGWPASVHEMPCDALVVSKSFHESNEALARSMRERGTRVVVDFCDDYFEDRRFGGHFRTLAALADVAVASTQAMADAIRRHASRDAVVIGDPVEGPRGVPAFAPRLPALRIAWFGHGSNATAIAARGEQLRALAARMPVRLTVVTTVAADMERLVADVARSAPGTQATLVPWSLEATWKALEDCDLAWMPAEDSAAKSVKSPNRLLETLWAGRLAVADAVPSYLEFADLVPVGKGLDTGVVRALADSPDTERRIREAQRRIARYHSPYACGGRWAAALGDDAPRAIRLNLGCGDKILPGYVNVDVVESRAGKKPDVICDLHDLAPFGDASADEILSVHVVEHFWRWEVRDVLREWLRVLKPGGRMIVECPNLASACRTFLENPQEYAREDQGGQRTMWVFYGDPKWKDPLMIHRWGYTPESLRALLEEVGLADVHPEPAQYKLREPRDMRIVGTRQ